MRAGSFEQKTRMISLWKMTCTKAASISTAVDTRSFWISQYLLQHFSTRIGEEADRILSSKDDTQQTADVSRLHIEAELMSLVS